MPRHAGDADARAHHQRPAVDDKRVFEIVQDFPRRQLGAIDIRGGQQHRELVAAQPRHGIGRPQGAAQPHRHFLQHLVAGVVAERVVHFLEAVEINQQHGEAALITMRSQDRLLQPVLEQRAIGQIGQRIVIGKIRNALIGQVALAPNRGLAQLAIHRRRQPRQVALHDVVVGAGLHRGHGGVFANGARDKNERQIGMLFADDGERLRAAKARHGVVRDHEIPLGFAELATQVGCRVYSARENVVASARERRYNQSRIVLGVFDLQQPQRRHVTRDWLARILRGSQSGKDNRSPNRKNCTPRQAEQTCEIFQGLSPMQS